MKKLNKQFILLFIFAMIIALTLIGCAPKTFTVTFKDGTEVITTQTVNKDDCASYVDLSNEVHEFVGWYLNKESYAFTTPVNQDITLEAKWTHTVTFVNADGKTLKTEEVEEGAEITPPTKNPSKASDDVYTYKFTGWDTPLVGTDKDMTIKPLYDSNYITYKVAFYNEKNEIVHEEEVRKNQSVASYAYSKSSDDYYDYTFRCWADIDGDEFDFNNKITSNTYLYAKFYRTPKLTSLTGKKVSFVGDSVSTFYASGSVMNSYYSGNDEFYYPKYSSTVKNVTQTYWYKLIQALGLELGVNNSWSGSALSFGSNAAMNSSRLNTLDENGTPDIIIIFIGINDNASGVSNSSFEGAYKTMLNRIIDRYPNAYILLTNHPYSNYHINQPTNHGKYSEETRLAYNEIIAKLADSYQVGLIDLAACQTTSNWSQYLGDNLHPNATGMIAWEAQFEKDIKAYFNIK